MAIYRIRPCARLSGEITVHSAKNAVLPLMCGALLTRETVTIEQIPALTDVKTLTDILRDCGVLMHADQAEKLLTMTADSPRSPRREDLLSRMRASVLVMGPLLARTGYARVALPGGCAIGQRPIDLHLKGMEALGAHVEQTPGFVTLRGKLRGGNVYLDFPSVGATENILMAAALARGTTRIENAAKEPEIADLCDFLTQMGAHISGGGTSTILIEGRETLHGCRYRPIPDRIEAGTLLCAAAMTEGSVLLRGVRPEHMRAVLYKLGESGVTLRESAAGLRLSGRATQPLQVRTLAYPGFPTDMQAPMMALALSLRGTSVFLETIFENRFMHAREMARMGASIRIEDRIALVSGGHPLGGTSVTSTDLRGGAALMLCGLLAEGETTLHDPNGQIARGYEDLPGMLRALGAEVEEE
ncbi:MAG: UDP-N-acetylglucosamine 1-carboxyvinyltransferase [Christensenellales bacterium]|nr:UDP-N-acetylglucosamine 1-carboxyvinyltransferase [Christensenellales bacterium]